MSATPYLTTPEAIATARRLEKKGLLDATYLVQLLPTTIPESNSVHFVLRYYANQYDEAPIAQVHFLDGGKASKSAAFIEQVQKMMKHSWRWGEFKPNAELVRLLPTLANTRRYKLQLLLDPAA